MRKLFQNFLIVCGILLSISIFSESAKACSCYLPETVDKEFAKYPNVVILKLQSIKQNEDEPTKYFLSVEKIFKGELKVSEVIYFKWENMCSWSFSEDEIGTEFLFYLGERPAEDKNWVDPKCSRSGRIKSVSNDISYLENEVKLRGKTRLSGRIVKWVETLDEFVNRSDFPLANRKIRVVGNGKTTNLTTDGNGAFEIYDLPPGKYKIYPGKLDGYTFQEEKTGFEEVEIKAKSQTEKDFYYNIANGISGKVVDREGKPLTEICVELYSLKMEKTLGFSHKSCTDEDGKFEISGIPEGSYKIVVNGEDVFDRSSRNPLFETFYYPNVETLEKATEIFFEANFFMKDVLFVPPAPVEMISVSGRLIYADGKPAAEQFVEFVNEEDISKSFLELNSDFEVKTDKNGEFTFKIPKGRAGILRGKFFALRGAHKNCPEIEELFKQTDAEFQDIETNRIIVTKDVNLNGIELKFPFSFCQEVEK